MWWRAVNYGPRRFSWHLLVEIALQVQLVSRSVLRRNIFPKVRETDQWIELLADQLELDIECLYDIKGIVTSFLHENARKFHESGVNMKPGVSGPSGPIGRLTAIGALLVRYSPDVFVETGTQFGVSADFAYTFCQKYSLPTRVISIDVKNLHLERGEKGYTCFVYEKKVSKEVRELFWSLTKEYQSFVFSHDSDHSYENMYWELKQAHKILQPIAYICDDVELHSAFRRFADNNQLPYLTVKVESFPAYGLILL